MRGRQLKQCALLVAVVLFALHEGASGADRAGLDFVPRGTGGFNAAEQVNKPYLVVISIDGMRWDFPDAFPTPAIQRFMAEGARAERLVPAWPTLTFPNHFTMVTGLLPHHHGLVANVFREPASGRWFTPKDRSAVQDGGFYTAQPIWVTAEAQGLVTATFFWVGSEASIDGVAPSHWRLFDKSVPGQQRVDQALQWLALPAERRPHLVTLYFENLDDQAHWYGIGSPEFLAALHELDAWLARLLDGLGALPHGDQVTIMIVSDHGQMAYTDAPPLILEEHIDLAGLELVDGGPFVFGWQREPDPGEAAELAARVNEVWQNGRAWTREDAPADWHLAGNPRNPHLVFLADPGHAVLSRPDMHGKLTAGDHGWAPAAPQMHGVFMARGPGIEAGRRHGPMRTVDTHALFMEVLGLRPQGRTDSDLSVVWQWLQAPAAIVQQRQE